jgi:hypothetical protein
MARTQFAVLGVLVAITAAAAAWMLTAPGEAANAPLSVTAKPGEWRYLNADPLSTRYFAARSDHQGQFQDP